MQTLMQMMIASAVAVGGALAPAASQAQQLVTNGGFETGDFSGWSESGAIGSVYGVDSAGPRNGNYSAYFGASSPPAFIAQSLATTAGQQYLVSFYFDRSPLTTGGSFSASLGGVEFYAGPAGTFAFAQVTQTVTALSDNAVLRFEVDNVGDFYTLDSVSVTAVPEPASAALLLVGLITVGRLARRRQSVG